MAIFHLKHGFLSRSSGASSIAKAAYNSGEKIEDNKGSTAYSDYTRKGGVLYGEITLPAGTPGWADNRGELWRRLEAREDRSTRRKDAVLAHNFDIALPFELTLEQNIFLARDFVREQFSRKGYPVDWAIHSPDPRGDSRNIHLHILVPLRKIEGDSYGKKDRYNRSQLRSQIRSWRKSWAMLANRHLKRYGHEVTIDERSLWAQGIKRRPTGHSNKHPKSTRTALNSIRPPQPRAPVITKTRTTGTDGSVKIQAIIKHSGLNNIRTNSPNIPPALKTDRKGWPEAAIRDWEVWGSKDTGRFFTLWRELAPHNFSPMGGPR